MPSEQSCSADEPAVPVLAASPAQPPRVRCALQRREENENTEAAGETGTRKRINPGRCAWERIHPGFCGRTLPRGLGHGGMQPTSTGEPGACNSCGKRAAWQSSRLQPSTNLSWHARKALTPCTALCTVGTARAAGMHWILHCGDGPLVGRVLQGMDSTMTDFRLFFHQELAPLAV